MLLSPLPLWLCTLSSTASNLALDLRSSPLCISGRREGSVGQHVGRSSSTATGLATAAADWLAVLVRHKAHCERKCHIELPVSRWVLCTVIWWHRCAPNNPSRRTFPPGMLWPSDLLWGMLTYLDPVYDQFSLLFSKRSPEIPLYHLDCLEVMVLRVCPFHRRFSVCSQALSLRKGRKATLC